MAGEMPNPFPWSIFLIGEAVGLAGFSLALIRSDQRRPGAVEDVIAPTAVEEEEQ